MTENAGPENGGSRLIRGWQILGGKMLHWKTKDQTSLLEKAGPESEGPNYTAWKMKVKGRGSPYSITEHRVPELIPVLGIQPAGDVSHKPGGRLPLLSARPAVTLATFKRAATSFAAW